MKRLLIVLFPVLLLIFGCTSPAPSITEAPEPAVDDLRPSLVMGKTVRGLAHYWTIDREGTRSEVKHGFLSFEGAGFPDCFSLVVCSSNGLAYYFATGDGMSDDGYWPMSVDEGDRFEFREPITELNPEDAAKGLIVGSTPKIDMPPTWLYVESGDFRAFIDPARVAAIVADFRLSSLPRRSGLELAP